MTITLDPRDFGGDPNGEHDSAPAINAAVEEMRSLVRKDPNDVWPWGAPVKVDGSGGHWALGDTVKVHDFRSDREWGLQNLNTFAAMGPEKVAFDLTGSRNGTHREIHVVGSNSATERPWSGIQQAPVRLPNGDDLLCSGHYFERCSTDGHFHNGGWHNFAGEENVYSKCQFDNRLPPAAGRPAYELIMDATGDLMQVKTTNTDLSPPGRKSFSRNTFLNCAIRKPFGISGPTIFLQDPTNITFRDCYLTCGDGPVIDWRLTGYEPHGVIIDNYQTETVGSKTFINFITNAPGERRIKFLSMLGVGSMVGMASGGGGEFFKVDGDISKLTIDRFEFTQTHWHADSPPTRGIFPQKAKVHIMDGDVHVPNLSDFGDPSSYGSFRGKVVGIANGDHITYRQGLFNAFAIEGATPVVTLKQTDGSDVQLTLNGNVLRAVADKNGDGIYETTIFSQTF